MVNPLSTFVPVQYIKRGSKTSTSNEMCNGESDMKLVILVIDSEKLL